MDPSARRPRVLHLATRYQRGGSEQRLRDLVAALPDAEHRVVVGVDSDLGLARAQLDCPVSMEPSLVRSPRPDQDLTAIFRVRSCLRRNRSDLIVTHQSKAGVVGRVAARAAGRVPAIHSLSMASFGPGYGRAESVVYRAIERTLAPWTNRYVVVGADLARRFEVAGVASEKLAIVRSAATLPGPRPSWPVRVTGVPDSRSVVLCLGALEPRKNPLDLVPMFRRVRVAVPDAFLMVAGDGPLSTDLRDAVSAAGLGDDVALLGYVEPIDPLLWRADAMVLLSNAEGLPQVLVQAAAAGVPFVTYDVDGGREVVALGAVGEVVALGDVHGAADALIRLLDAGCRHERSVDARSWDPDVIHSAYRRIVTEVLSGVARAG